MKDLMAQHHIQSEEDLLTYMKENLPKNHKGEVLLPQINMKHPTVSLEKSEADILREKLAKVEDENESLKVTIEDMKRHDVASKLTISLNEKIIGLLQEKIDAAEGDKLTLFN